jgi:Uma2 family endonuclease
MDQMTKLVTADDLWQMPGNGRYYELVKGELHPMPPSGGEHGEVTINLTGPMWTHATVQDLGRLVAAETGFVLARDPDTVRGSDIAFIRKDRIPAGGLPKKFIPFAPDVAVEVVSPTDRMEDVEEKVAEWLAAGTTLVWVVVPKRRIIKVYRTLTNVKILTDKDELDGEDVMPGFRLPVARVFG